MSDSFLLDCIAISQRQRKYFIIICDPKSMIFLFPLVVIDGDGDEYMYFPLQFDNYKFTIGLSHILMCLKLAEEEESIPLLSKDSWYELENFYHELIKYEGIRI